MKRDIFRLHDSAIMGIVRVIQQGFLTGTDISDHMRMLRFEPMRDDPETLTLTDEYLTQETDNVQKMLDDVDRLSALTDDVSSPAVPESTVWTGYESAFTKK